MPRVVTGQRRERVRRIQIGLTGLAAVFLVVAGAGVLTRAASEERAVAMAMNGTNAVVPENLSEEPLADLGVAPAPGPAANASPPGSAPN